MFINASRSCKRGLAGLAVCSALMASTFAANAGASIFPPPVPPPPTDAVLVKSTDLIISATTATTIRVRNTGDRAAGPFSITVASGYMADQCGGGWPIPAVSKRVSGLAGGQAITVTIAESSTARNAIVDNPDIVAESNEHNNAGTVPGGTSIVC